MYLVRSQINFEEYTTILTSLNSRLLIALSCDDGGCEATNVSLRPTPGSIARSSLFDVSLLRCWHLCQNLVRHFWQRWSVDYLSSLRNYAKWHQASPNLSIGDIVVVNEDGMVPIHGLWVV